MLCCVRLSTRLAFGTTANRLFVTCFSWNDSWHHHWCCQHRFGSGCGGRSLYQAWPASVSTVELFTYKYQGCVTSCGVRSAAVYARLRSRSAATDVIVASSTHKDLSRGLARIYTLALKQRAARINALSSMRGPS